MVLALVGLAAPQSKTVRQTMRCDEHPCDCGAEGTLAEASEQVGRHDGGARGGLTPREIDRKMSVRVIVIAGATAEAAATHGARQSAG